MDNLGILASEQHCVQYELICLQKVSSCVWIKNHICSSNRYVLCYMHIHACIYMCYMFYLCYTL